eukprot:CAMPEP_0194281948 /NCGR_PEP_ID=MMETSP0169-20130528/21998_1 /TAXON_ID=218684 /ORGANISM="Corethron pennatum, Strain L29A3" /LENGTH=424 /DNA_ID=CAMNT_0039027143 /DNA_START=25 /DNA_END=1299 /DNA_ORIENTATION=-
MEHLPPHIRNSVRLDIACGRCHTTQAKIYAEDFENDGMICGRCTFLDIVGPGAEYHPNCPPLPKDICRSIKGKNFATTSKEPSIIGQLVRSIKTPEDGDRSKSLIEVKRTDRSAEPKNQTKYKETCRKPRSIGITKNNETSAPIVVDVSRTPEAASVPNIAREPQSPIEPGQVVRILGLKNGAEYNGRFGVTRSTVITTGSRMGRVEVMPCRGAEFLALKPENLRHQFEPSGKRVVYMQKNYQVVMFWPDLMGGLPGRSDDVIVNPLLDWPEDSLDEYMYLKVMHAFAEPEPLSGIPDFIMYYDSADTTSPVNKVANSIASLLPNNCVGKSPPQKEKTYRGPCVIVYDPIESSFPDGRDETCEDLNPVEETMWSLAELQEVLYFHTTREAQEMYRRRNCMTREEPGTSIQQESQLGQLFRDLGF